MDPRIVLTAPAPLRIRVSRGTRVHARILSHDEEAKIPDMRSLASLFCCCATVLAVWAAVLLLRDCARRMGGAGDRCSIIQWRS